MTYFVVDHWIANDISMEKVDIYLHDRRSLNFYFFLCVSVRPRSVGLRGEISDEAPEVEAHNIKYTTGNFWGPNTEGYARNKESGNLNGTLKFNSGLQKQSPHPFLFYIADTTRSFEVRGPPQPTSGTVRHSFLHTLVNTYLRCIYMWLDLSKTFFFIFLEDNIKKCKKKTGGYSILSIRSSRFVVYP